MTHTDGFEFVDINNELDVEMEKIDQTGYNIDWGISVDAGKFSETNFIL